ncbi:hypothetical protein EDB84DRAFT_1572462 [Lactarius hengduanensis]|nr:hypothetical protein EDB84DRAFT_1572462 [Lactarius hengduanensis]
MAPRRTTRTSPLVPSTDNQPTPTPPVQRSGARLQACVLEEGENFNLGDISGGDESDDEEDDPPVNRAHTQEMRSMARHETQINYPGHILAPDDESKTPAADTRYFFGKHPDVGKAICNHKLYRKARDADPGTWIEVNYQYSLNTSTTTLRGHIKKHHLDVYLTLAKARGWNTSLVVKGQSQTSDSVASGAAQGDNQRNSLKKHSANTS